jgi:nucleotide-binding universal stress UspA family protein
MKKILVATDFSTRSDRAIRRATLLARKFEAAVSLIHVVDDDRPKRIVDAERESASILLSEQARSAREIDGVDCSAGVLLGAIPDEIIKAAEAGMADILVIGPHRHHAFLDVFVGTTAERTIRSSRRPLLVASGVPAGFYRHVLVAVDLSDCSGDALRVLAGLGLDKHAAVSVVHVFSAPARSSMAAASASSEDIEDYLAREEKRAAGELSEFMRGLAFSPARQVLKLDESSVAHIICVTAREVSADLIVVGTRGLTGVTKFLLGSVAEEVLHISDRDVLAVPPRRGS